MTGNRRPLQAVILDWAGTTVDYGSRAPARVFIEIFRARGVEITEAEARGPMGRSKRDHIAAVAALPRIAAAWRERHGRHPRDADVDKMYADFLPLQKRALATGSDVIPGIPQAIAELREMGLKIGSTTGYTRELMDVVAPLAVRGGYAPDVIVCSDEVAQGRPAADMNLRAAELLGVTTMSAALVVDDTAVGIAAGFNAGAGTVGISQTGNALGLSAAEVAALPGRELDARLAKIEQDFLAGGAHHVLRTVADLPSLVRQVSDHLAS